jgi:SAM-dependent methyltransferase
MVPRVTNVTAAGTAGHAQGSVAAYYRQFFVGRSLVLDIGCGKGDYLDVGWVGADYDLDSLHGSARVVQVDLARGLPFHEGSFEGILAKDVVEHVADPRGLLREAHRVAAPGARLVLVTPRAIPRAVWADYTHVRGFTKGALKSVLVDSGWIVDRVTRMGGLPMADRLNFVAALPTLLAIPGLGHYFGTNWQVLAHCS